LNNKNIEFIVFEFVKIVKIRVL